MATTKEKPIVFSGPEVRAILAGRKTQFRVPVKPQPLPETDAMRDIPSTDRWWAAQTQKGEWGMEYRPLGSDQQHQWRCPMPVGSLLWVKEAWEYCDHEYLEDVAIAYIADDECKKSDAVWIKCPIGWPDHHKYGRKSPIHMPRWASRIALRVTDVRVQQVREITLADCAAEGAEPTHSDDSVWDSTETFRAMWDAKHGKRYPWNTNPWVWAYTFEVTSKK